MAENGPIVKSSRPTATPADASAAAIEASESVAGPDPPPAASNCAATVSAHEASCPLSVSQSCTAVTRDCACSVPQHVLHPDS